MSKCCHCCSFDNLYCRLRTLKAAGALLFVFGIVFALAGIAFGFFLDFIDDYLTLPDVFPQYTLYTVLVTTTGISAVVAGLGAIYMSKTWSDDGCSTRGVSILALLTIVLSLASVGIPAWQLYEDNFFLEIPPQSLSGNASELTTTSAMTTVPMMMDATSMITEAGTINTTTNNMMNATMASMNATEAAANVTESMASDNSTTMANATASSGDNTTTTMTMNATMTSSDANATTGGMNMTSSADSNVTANSSSMTSGSEGVPPTEADSTTPDLFTNSTSNGTTTTVEPHVPLDYDLWFAVIVPFGIICFFAFIFIIFAFLIFAISCCCPGRSEIVDDKDIYKS